MKCAKCGNTLDDGALFCSQCGAVVGASYAPPPEQAGFPAPAPSPPPPATLPDPDFPRFTVQVARLPARVKAILLSPRTEWPVIAGEATTPRAIYTGYVGPLAAIGPIALFAGQVLIGTPLPLIGVVRAGIAEGIVAAIFTFALALVSVWLLAQVIDVLAPQFGGQRDSLRALKSSAYSYTPAWLAGALHVIPAWGILALPAALYGLYILYLGLPVLMRCPPQQAGPYTGAVAACAIVLFFFFGGLTTSWPVSAQAFFPEEPS